MTQKNFQEKRRHPRIENNVPFKIYAPDIDLVTETKNISCAGAYCKISKFLEPMTKLKITLLLPVRKGGKVSTKKLSCGGVVVRTENIPNSEDFFTAIFFNDILPRDAQVLAGYVKGALEQEKAAVGP